MTVWTSDPGKEDSGRWAGVTGTQAKGQRRCWLGLRQRGSLSTSTASCGPEPSMPAASARFPQRPAWWWGAAAVPEVDISLARPTGLPAHDIVFARTTVAAKANTAPGLGLCWALF